jgi:hypothetical protein
MSEYKVQRNESGSSSFGGVGPGGMGSTGVGEFFGRRVGDNIDGSNYFKVARAVKYYYDEAMRKPTFDEVGHFTGWELGVIGHSGYYYEDVDANQGGNCQTCLIPSTAGQNYYNTNYTGPHNPLSYDRSENYSLPPTNRADAGSMFHDKGYDSRKAIGPGSVFMDMDVIDIDYKFIGYELDLAANPYSGATLTEKGEGLLNGLGMFVFTLPKTIVYVLSLSDIKN